VRDDKTVEETPDQEIEDVVEINGAEADPWIEAAVVLAQQPEHDQGETSEENEIGEEAVGKRPGGIFAMIRIGVFLTVLIAVECVIAIIVIPSAEETAAMAQKLIGGDGSIVLPEEDEGATGKEVDPTIEVFLGEFHVSVFQPLSNTTVRIDFELYGTVLADNQTEFDERFFENQHRLREQVIVTLRSTDMADLADAGLGLIKRKILETTNRTLGKAIVKEVIFSGFSFIEQ